MALTVVAGFSFQLAMGRSTFGSPLRVHVHAIAFMGWVVIFLLQTYLATRGPLALHRKLGWFAAGWIVLMIGAAMAVIIVSARNGTIPFFFQPQLLMVGDPINLLAFAVLTYVAIAMRKRTDWHDRLHLGAMALLTAPAFGRLLPLPLLIPWSFEAAGVATMVFPIAGMIRDRRVLGRVHPAWFVTVAVFLAYTAAYEAIAYSPLGDALYAAVTAGSHGAYVPGLQFPPPPAGPLVTGR
ncbi:hypothetical protein ACFO0A_12745 [Novosphingobium tardum]|uniref:Uncharacterized protein n=1 Tax=Novosphingobium tardum TaxID=1538021 RepID=A0ABV8RRA0_9SPHN